MFKNYKKTLPIFITVFLAILVLFCFKKEAQTDYFVVDLSKSTYKQKSMAGFLHDFDEKNFQNIVKDLKPRYWRIGGNWINDPVKRTRIISDFNSEGIQPIFILSSAYKYKRMNIKGWIDPADNPKPFLDLVEKQYRYIGNTVIYDVWNEPNHKSYWQRSDDSFFVLFKQVHDRIRSLPGGEKAIISGPGVTGKNSAEYLTKFVKFCHENNVKVDVLNWHDMRVINSTSSAEEFRRDIMDISNNVKNYPNAQVKSILLPEVIGNKQQYSPVAPIYFYSTLEKTSIDGTCKACWENSAGENNCFNKSLDGLYTKQGDKRAVWWAYKLYAISLERRLKPEQTIKNAEIISFFNENKELAFIIATSQDKTIQSVKIKVKNSNKVYSLANKRKVTVSLFEIPDGGEAPLNNPNLVLKNTLSLSNTEIVITFDSLKSNSLYFATLN